jgi:hypothetical protein
MAVKDKKRNYKKENEWQNQPEQVKRRMARNRARAKMEREGKVHKGDGKEVDHKNFNPNDNSSKNLRVVDRSTNRRRQPKTKGK